MKPALATGGGPRPRAPIGLQLVGLLLACLLAAQAISLAVISLMPPPRPPIYRVSELAAAIRGEALATRAGVGMTREITATLPAELSEQRGDRALGPLADALGLPMESVRLIDRGPSPVWRLARRLRGHDLRRERMMRQGPPPGLAGPGAHGPPPEMRRLHMPEPAVFGEFIAAARAPGGRWVVVRSSPEPFPSAWQRRIALWMLGGFLVIAPAGYLFARRITAPLKRFAEAAETLGRDPHAPQMALKGPAEIGAAAEAFNKMQARLKRYIDDRTAMVGAISHDLRTPLARIRFKVETAPDAMKASVIRDIDQMEQMIGGVLAFIRDEGGPRRREKLDLLSLLEVVVDDAALVGGDAEIVEGQPVTVDGDPGALQRLFGNLVQNALIHGHAARVTVRQAGGLALVEIADRGPGLSPADLERVFQPFYRADIARNLDNGGVGLGLPIARSAARAHGGDVELLSGPGGVTARVTLPLARP